MAVLEEFVEYGGGGCYGKWSPSHGQNVIWRNERNTTVAVSEDNMAEWGYQARNSVVMAVFSPCEFMAQVIVLEKMSNIFLNIFLYLCTFIGERVHQKCLPFLT